MTRKHFNAIAEAVYNNCYSGMERKRLAEQIADIVGPLNNRFQRQRFIDACLYGDKE